PGHPPTLFLSSVGCLNPTAPLFPTQTMDFWDSRRRVIALIESLKAFYPAAFRHEATTRIENAWVEIIGEPSERQLATLEPSFAAALDEPSSLPISRSAAENCAEWLMKNFGDELKAATKGKRYKVKHLCAIVCQETAYKWLGWIDKMSPKEIVERCVFDASGDYPGAPRTAFPKNTAAFLQRYGQQFTAMLIEEANKTRRLQDYSDRQWVYKGYGIFQYDLQHVTDDETFFKERRWYDFDACLLKCCEELDEKLKDSGGDLWDAIRHYNGSGPRAQTYMANVKAFTEYCAPVTGD
ncbi:peptidase S8/S53 subtilisin kexin sedolisin, partial [Rhizobium ruizarguesonis]|uniref:peptidase S8/S53 subtilisin kexin sedolisin n=1 Tax=Rhizobium ruizarguesonis TaxID=2081791 RepID=UPI001A8E4EA0